MFYAHIKENKLLDITEVKYLNEDILNIEVMEDVFNAYCETPNKFIWDGESVVLNPNYETEEAQKEAERIAKLYLTGADVERGIYQAKGMDFDDIIAFVMANPPEGLDIKALKIELKANHFYRGNPYVDSIGNLLGFTKEQLDKFFETNNYIYLCV